MILTKGFLIFFGGLVLIAGAQGLAAGSKVSMIAAAVLGGCLLAGGFLLASGPTLAMILALVGSVGIAGRFVPAFLKSKSKLSVVWPAGTMAVLGVVGIVLAVRGLIKW